jgi:hypothetical protein
MQPTNPIERSIFENVISRQLIQEFPTFYETRKFVATFTKETASGFYPEPFLPNPYATISQLSDKS